MQEPNKDSSSDLKILLRIGENSIQGRRRTQEDSHIYIPNVRSAADDGNNTELKTVNPAEGILLDNSPASFALFGVFDGHGGSVASAFVAANLPKYLLEEFDKNEEDSNSEKLCEKMEESLKKAFARIESEFLRKAQSEDLKDGTTAVTAILHRNNLIVGNIGDSEIIMSRKGKPVSLVNVHNPKRNPDEAQRIVEEGGKLYYDRLAHPSLNGAIFNIAVSRAIGDIFFKMPEYTKNKNSALTAIPDIKSIPLTADDEFMLLACDGLWDVMSHQDAIDFVLPKLQETNDPQFICQLLVDEAYRLGSQDNITSVLITFKSWAADDAKDRA